MDVCGLCKTNINPGAVVCVGCQGSVVYGATAHELSAAFNIAFCLSFVLCLFAALKIFGFALSSLIGAVVAALVVGAISRSMAGSKRAGMVRTFRYH